jgi:hypothetical protein
MKLILIALANSLAAFGRMLAKPFNVAPLTFALQIHILIFAVLFIVFTLAGAYEFLMLLHRLMR